MVSEKQAIGFAAEERAQNFLEKQGFTLLEKNFKRPVGEIDLIFKDKEYVVFVEVRSVNGSDFASALESIGPNKQHKIIRTAACYLLEKKWLNKVDCRFDIVAIDAEKMEWFKNAFEVKSNYL